MANASQVVSIARASFEKGVTKSLDWRIKQLQGIRNLVIEQEDVLCKALYNDLRKSKMESIMTELTSCKNEVLRAIKHIHEWTKPTYVSKSLVQTLDTMFLHKEPLGVVLIIAPWNYPILLIVIPLIAAITAGNCVVIKPSEISANTAKTLEGLLPQYIDKDCFPVYTGGIPEVTKLLEEKFDKIFFTGSPNVGKIIMAAAAKQLTPVTLELGGKSPVYIDKNVHIKLVARRLAWGKLMNSGQTCVAPDYALCHKDVKDNFLKELKVAITEMVGENPIECPDYGRIISDTHMARLTAIIEKMPKEKLVFGGDLDADTRFIAPTVYQDVSMDDIVMQSELFGPILPVISVSGYEEAIKIINTGEKPLSMYIFSNTNGVISEMMNNTSSGSICVNDTMMQMASSNLPFGGVGNSGFGRYHGKYGFDTFIHEKSVCWRKQNMEGVIASRYMPFSESKLNMVKRLTEEDRVIHSCIVS